VSRSAGNGRSVPPAPPSNRRIMRPAAEATEDSPPPAAVSRSVRPAASEREARKNTRDKAPAEKPARPKGPGLAARLASRLAGTFAALKLLVGVVIVVSASAGVAWGARRYVLSSPRFAVKTIAVEGASRTTADAVAAAGGIAVGDNVLAADLEGVARKIEADPWVATATVRRKLPSTLLVAVVEHEPAVVVVLGGELYLATRDGVMFKKHELGDPADLPLVTGVRPDQVKDDRQGAELVVRRAADVAAEIADSAVGRRWPVQEVHVEKDGTTVALVGREGIALHLGLPPYKPKVQQAERVLMEIAKRRADASMVFLDNDTNPDRVVVRMK
jgi:cell division protein FtsQ